MKRKLAVVLAADVEGCSRLMGVDDEATRRTLSAYREIIDGLIARHEGRVFGAAGDSVLAEFGSAVEAARAAVAIQRNSGSATPNFPTTARCSFGSASTSAM